MAYTVNLVDMWSGEIADRAGGLAAKLEPLAGAGADLEVVVARRQAHKPGKGVVYLGPVVGAKARKAAQAAGLTRASDLVALRVEGPNKPGESHRLTRLLADAGINLRGLAATVIGNKFVASLGFDTDADAGKAARLLRSAGGKRK
ncbi:MAG TPA: ACT domain-containing protein [Gemmataceae bacterium]|nr:ACT domain-containing protein [Gemmataceae bacterium]